ncbi:MAG TPA: hypothetical protein VLS93_12885 [Anaeromyxobacteraceae bacterium]|nr:hypothetical protein [Anaeromyxobacteraceae bacterium]
MTDRPSRLPAHAPLVAAAALLLAAPGAALAETSLLLSGSAFVDYWYLEDPAVPTRTARGVTPATSLKVSVDVTDDLSFSAKVCAGCHSMEMEQVALDYTPKTWFNVQLGRLAIPFGDFSNRVDPSGHATVSAPLIYDMGQMAFGERSAMNLGVLPLPYVDTGAMLYGVRWLGPIQLWYGLYGVAGLRGATDVDWMAMRSVYTDVNGLPAVGGRITLTVSAPPKGFFGDFSLGGSATAGHYDREEQLRYLVYGADVSFRLGPVTVRGEYAARRTELDPDGTYPYELIDDWFDKRGFYAELEHPLTRYFTAVYRYEEMRRVGVPLPGSIAEMTPDGKLTRATAGLVFNPVEHVFAKFSWEYTQSTDFGDFQSFRGGIGGAF